MGLAARWRGAALVLGACAAALVACSSGPRSVLPTPGNGGDCGPASDPGNPDGGVVAGLEWPGGKRKFGESGRAYLCLGFAGSIGTLSALPGVTVRPARFSVPEKGVVPVSVTVRRSGRATLWLELTNIVGRVELRRAVADVVADGSGWRCAKPSA